MASFNPGDIFIDNLMIVSPRTTSWNMARNFLSCNILETIFIPAVTAEIEIVDDQDYIGKLKIAGDEQVAFTMRKPNGIPVSYNFHLNSVKEVEPYGALKSKVYKLDCITRESLSGQANHVQKAFNTTIDQIIQDLHKNFHNSNLPLFAEATKGNRKFNITNQPSFHAIEMLRKEAVSAQNKGSNFMFWQTWRGLYFQSLEYMLQQGDVKTFKQENTVGHSINSNIENNILAIKVQQNMDAMNRIHAGVINQRVCTYDPHTHKFVSHDFKPKTEELISLGVGLITTLATFTNLFPKANQTVFRIVNPNKNIQIDKSYVPSSIPYKQLNMAQMQEQLMHMTVIGDPILEPGKTIKANVPKITAETNNKEADPQMSGRWLITKSHHEVRRPDVRPRYVTNLECLKGAFEEKI